MADKNKQNKNSFARSEEDVLKFWEKSDTFQKTLRKDSPRGDYVFYDGPPFATGMPHYGHLVANIMKDVVPRYWTMKGCHVERKWGWDCHGLPVENIAEKELELGSKKDIEEMGIDKFNEYCRSIVMRYAEDWKSVISRIARWVDMEDDYKTMNSEYMESIWWVFKSLWEKGYVYKGYKSMHICPRCGTTLSNFEVGLGYKDIKDLSVIARFELADEPGTFVLAWTTTPWTLLGNVVLAVGEEIDYVKFDLKGDPRMPDGTYITAKKYFNDIKENIEGGIELLDNLGGSDLVGKGYKPLFDHYSNDKDLENKENGWKIYAGDFVSTEEGTGVVHIAPAFGEDDMEMGKEHELPFVQHVAMDGKFVTETGDFAGMEVKPKDDHQRTDVEVIKYLSGKGLLFHKEKYEHSYPHCWRCETPLLNYATDSWFVKVTAIKEDLIKNNQKVNWVPHHIKDGRFGKWLEQARDWAISRDRYWGAPLPVWECDSCEEKKVVGSKKELQELSGKEVGDLHKHFVDDIEFKCEKCTGKMRRVASVLDCWFESGSMPYAQMHYPMENVKRFENNFPAEFVAEGLDQTRGWFYTLMVLATALFGKPAFNNVIVNGIVLAEDGHKMSKSKNNYPDPSLVFDKYSVDAVRYYLLSSPVLTGDNLNFSEDGVKEVLRNTSLTIWNVYKFYSLFASDDTAPEPGKVNILDKWVLSRLGRLKNEVSSHMDDYVIPKAVRPIEDFISDLSTWYLRRSRGRFKSDDNNDKQDALATTKYVLLELSKVMAPFMPFISEQIWQKVSGFDFRDGDRSVHLEDWPDQENIDGELISNMEKTRDAVEAALSKRDESGIKVRQPLASLVVKNAELSDEYKELIADEVNVKNVEVEPGEGGIEAELDTKITPELAREGAKREMVRAINNIRKNEGLTINDRIAVHWNTDDGSIAEVIREYEAEIKKETLSDSMEMSEEDDQKEVKINGAPIKLSVTKLKE